MTSQQSSICRLLVDPPASGGWNMAVDEVLMEWAAESGRCCLRFYRWREPTLSLGYFQAYADRAHHLASRNCPAVRRTSGGGAILHDVELTYSIVLPKKHQLAAKRLALYKLFHEALVGVLRERGVTASICKGPNESEDGRQAFLCFQRRAPGDVLVEESKIAGSAQRRSPGAVLQHGSVLLNRSAAAPELPGANDLSEKPISDGQLIDAWLRELGHGLCLTWQDGALAEAERDRALQLVQAKYGSHNWTKNR